MDKRLIYKSQHHKSHRGEHRQENVSSSPHQYFHLYVPKSKGHKRNNKQMGLHQNNKKKTSA